MSVQANGTGDSEFEEIRHLRRNEDADQHTAVSGDEEEIPVLDEQWRKSNRSNNNGACVEVRQVGTTIEVRDSKAHGEGPVLGFTTAEWNAFVGGVADGEFRTA